MTSGQTVSRSTDPVPPYSKGCVTQPRGTGPASWASARGTWGDAASGGLSRARSSPGGVGAELQPLANPGEAPGVECSACDPHGEAQGEPDLVPWAPCPTPSTRVPGARVSSLAVPGGISQPSPREHEGRVARGGRAAEGGRGSTGPSTPRPAPCGAALLTPEAQLPPFQGTQVPTAQPPPWPADPCLPAPSCAGPCVTLFPSCPP